MTTKLAGKARSDALAALKEWKEVPGRDAIKRSLKFADFKQTLISIRNLENLRKKFAAENDREGLRLVRDTALRGKNRALMIAGNEKVEAQIFNDILEPINGGEVIATFQGNYYDGEPALVVNKLGKGSAYYFGAGFSPSAAEVFLTKLGFAETFKETVELPREVEIAVRTKADKEYIFLLNYMAEEKEITFKKTMINLLTGEKSVGKVKIEKYGVMILESIK